MYTQNSSDRRQYIVTVRQYKIIATLLYIGYKKHRLIYEAKSPKH